MIVFSLSRVRDIMVPFPQLMNPAATLQQAARKMTRTACGALPVGTPEKFHGIITNDIVVHAIARGKNLSKEVIAGYTTSEVVPDCYENDTLECAAEIMHAHKVGQLIVRDSHRKVTGILSFETILREDIRPEEMAHIVKHVIEPIYI